MKTYARRRSCGGGAGAGLSASIVSLDEVCRLCLAREDQLVPIFGQEQPVPLALRIMACVALEVVEDDGLPGMICRPCHYQLEKYYVFRKKCENSDLKLRMHLKQLTESSAMISGSSMNEDDEDRFNSQPANEQALVGASITIAIPEDGEGDMEMDDHRQEMEETNHITLPQDFRNDSRQACTLKREIELIEEKDIVCLGLDDKDDDVHVKDEGGMDSKIMIMDQSLLTESEENIVDADRTEDSHTIFNDSEGLSVKVFSSTEGDPTHFEVTTEDGSILHMELTTEDAKPVELNENGDLLFFKCEQCPKSFSRLIDIKRHSLIHTGQRGITCKFCDKWFPSQSSYTRHERIHTGEKPYQCGICQRCFAQKEILLRHMLIHSEVKPYNCDICKKGFTQREALKTHMLSHSTDRRNNPVHKCPLCVKTFCHASGLSRHLLMHAGRTFICTDCQKVFNDKSSLKRHIRVSGHHSN